MPDFLEGVPKHTVAQEGGQRADSISLRAVVRVFPANRPAFVATVLRIRRPESSNPSVIVETSAGERSIGGGTTVEVL